MRAHVERYRGVRYGVERATYPWVGNHNRNDKSGTDESAKCQRLKRKGRNWVWLLVMAQKLWLNEDMFLV